MGGRYAKEGLCTAQTWDCRDNYLSLAVSLLNIVLLTALGLVSFLHLRANLITTPGSSCLPRLIGQVSLSELCGSLDSLESYAEIHIELVV